MRASVGPTRSTATHNVAFRREAYLDYPFPAGSGAKAVALQSAAMLHAHYVLWTHPGMRVQRDRRGVPQMLVRLRYSTARGALAK